MKCGWLILGCLLAATTATAQKEPFRTMFYNVENLFDCRDDSLKADEEFLPTSIRAWHEGRLKQKIYHLGQVIAAVGKWDAPALVGLCEVENAYVMDRLVKYSPLKEYGYRYVMTDSPDERGIDVALLWQRGSFKMLQHRSIRIPLGEGRRPTRDILHATGLVMTGDSLDVFVCHFPSRSNGWKETEPARLKAASLLKAQIDSICRMRCHPNILVMGDFNDGPDNASLAKALDAAPPGKSIQSHALYNLIAGKGEGQGTYRYKGEWDIFDQILVSGFLLQHTQGLHTSDANARICDFPFLLEEDPAYGGKKPFRTYHGLQYTGGYSDHLPVAVDFILPD